MTTYKLTYFGARARAELIRLIFVQAEVEFENERLPYYAGTAEWPAKKASKHFVLFFLFRGALAIAFGLVGSPCY